MKLDQLLAAMDSMAIEKPRAVFIKGLGEVHIREITIGEIDAQIEDTADKKNKRGIARGACRLLADEDGNRLLDPDNRDHIDRMAKLPLRVLTAINKAADLDEAEATGN
jgi:hypothetical protein